MKVLDNKYKHGFDLRTSQSKESQTGNNLSLGNMVMCHQLSAEISYSRYQPSTCTPKYLFQEVFNRQQLVLFRLQPPSAPAFHFHTASILHNPYAKSTAPRMARSFSFSCPCALVVLIPAKDLLLRLKKAGFKNSRIIICNPPVSLPSTCFNKGITQ